MSTDEYVPSDARMREQYIWAHAREAEGVAEQSYAIQVCSEAWDAWLAAHDARVRRDAASRTHPLTEQHHPAKENTMTEDRLAMRLRLIRKETERAIRNGTKLDPRLIRAMCDGTAKA